tara:strand:- start:85 stop:1494 length:1410 start_codon:yes stop_codon:yes gene_type:complete
MPVTNLPIIKGDRTDARADYTDALPVNLTAVARSILGASGYLLSHAGLTLHGIGLGKDRAGYWNERLNIHFRVSGNDLISVADDGAVVSLGTITGTKQASMTHSFNTQSIVVDGRWWLYDGTTLTRQTDTDLGVPIDHTWIDGYYFFTDGESIYHTDITDETSISPLKFETSEFSPDPTLGVSTTSDNQVIVFNRYTTEYFINRAAENFAFKRISGKAVKCGAVGTFATTELDSKFFVIGGGRDETVSVHVISAGTYTSIATREVDQILATYTDAKLQNAVLETRVEDDDKFLVARLPNHTLLFNATIASKLGKESAWTIVKSGVKDSTKWRGTNGVFDPRIAQFVYGDNQNTNIGILDRNVASQYGEQVETLFYSPLVNLETASIDELEIDTIPGHQINSSNVTLAISQTTNGFSYGKEIWSTISSPSAYQLRYINYMLGYVDQNVGYKFRCVTTERVNFLNIKVTYG